jgi:hypothetical protein
MPQPWEKQGPEKLELAFPRKMYGQLQEVANGYGLEVETFVAYCIKAGMTMEAEQRINGSQIHLVQTDQFGRLICHGALQFPWERRSE